MKIVNSDCLVYLKQMPDNSIDAIVTDPPYGLSFMGKKWDYDVPSQEIWEECLRVLKPGGYLLSFAGTRTQHRMAVRIEDAGFEIRDMIAWIYGSGFPKSLNIGKSVNQLETNEWSKISKSLDNIDQKSIMKVWKTNAKPVGIQLSKSLTEVGSNTPKKFFVPDIAVLYSNQKNELLNAIIAEMRLKGLSLILEEDGIIAVENAGQTIELLPENARLAVKLSESPNLKCWNIFTAQCDVKEWLNENTEVNHKVDEALKTLRGNKKYSNEEITSVLCAVIPSVLKLTILNQSKTFQNLDTNQKMECASAINVIITEYTAENLISNTVAILKSKAVDKIQGNEREVTGEREVLDIRNGHGREYGSAMFAGEKTGKIIHQETKGTSEWEGWGTALKPALEPITVARKPLEKGLNVAQNCLKWGVGGINIDATRIPSYTDAYSNDDTFPSHKLSELRGKLYTLLFSCSADKKDFQIPSNVSEYALKWKELKDYLDGCSIYLRLYDELTPIFQEGDQVSFQQLHDAHDGIFHFQQEQSDNLLNQDTDHPSSLDDFLQLISTYIKDNDYTNNDTTPDIKSQGRFPANLITDGSDEVVGLFPQTKSGGGNKIPKKDDIMFGACRNNIRDEKFMDTKPDSGSAARFFMSCKYTPKDAIMNICEDSIYVNNVGNSLPIMSLIESVVNISSVLKSATPNLDLLNHYLNVLFVEKKSESIVIDFVAKLVAISEVPEGVLNQQELTVIQDFITSCKGCSQTQNPVSSVGKWEDTDITQIIINLLRLCGYVLLATEENTNSGKREVGVVNGEPKRFLYCSKASKSERNRGCEGMEEKVRVRQGLAGEHKDTVSTNSHPTVKPIALMEYLVKLVSKEGHTVLDPFMGSGSTGIACKKLGREFIGIEKEADYCKIAEARIGAVQSVQEELP